MTLEYIKKLLEEGEGQTVEFKENVRELNNSVFETVCSFSNRYGGFILLGVRDDGTVLGVDPKAAPDMKKNFINMLANPQKISPALMLQLEEIEIDGKLVLFTYVPISSQVEVCSGKIFDRNGDADIDVTKLTDVAAHLYGRKSTMFTEREIFPYVTKKHLRLDLMPRVRQLALSHFSEHPWENMSDMDILKSAGLYEEDTRTGTKGFNLAAILLFGRDEVIQSCVPGYVTDAILRKENLNRYDDRLIVETNLIEGYDLLMGFLAKHTLDRFFLIEDQRVSVRTWIAREIVGNLLSHRDYSKAIFARIIIENDRIYAENRNRSNKHGRIDPDNFTPESKNPLIAKFFMNIGRADQLGSGVRNLYYYTKIYSGGEPELIEGDMFKTIVPLTPISGTRSDNVTYSDAGVVVNVVENVVVNVVEKRIEEVFMAIKKNGKTTKKELSKQFGVTERTIDRYISALKKDNRIIRIGSDRSGQWETIE